MGSCQKGKVSGISLLGSQVIKNNLLKGEQSTKKVIFRDIITDKFQKICYTIERFINM
jgi:hypothetical protein